MQYEIHHVSEYTYSAPVSLEPQRLLLLPIDSPAVHVLSHRLEISPSPDGESIILDPFNNRAGVAWFSGQTSTLRIASTAVVEPYDHNPFDFLVYPAACAYLPMIYPADTGRWLEIYRAPSPPSEAVGRFAERVQNETGGQTLNFLIELCARIARDFAYEHREKGLPREADETLRIKGGACRDLTVLFLAAARAVGLAARYASGYALGQSPHSDRELHAWAEVYVPGAGWIGFDPALGLATSNEHVCVATAPVPSAAAPVQGLYRGAATAGLHYSIDIRSVGDGSLSQHGVR